MPESDVEIEAVTTQKYLLTIDEKKKNYIIEDNIDIIIEKYPIIKRAKEILKKIEADVIRHLLLLIIMVFLYHIFQIFHPMEY